MGPAGAAGVEGSGALLGVSGCSGADEVTTPVVETALLTASTAGAAAAPSGGDVACSVCSVADPSDGRLSAGCCLAGGLLLDAEAGEGTSGAGLPTDAGGGVVLLSDGAC